jgi:hypothetical protein
VEYRQPDRELQLRIALDQHVGVLPPRRPRAAMLRKQTVESERAGTSDAVERGALIRDALSDALVPGDAIEHPV